MSEEDLDRFETEAELAENPRSAPVRVRAIERVERNRS